MFCTNCGNRLENYNKFCPNCGSQIINGAPPTHYQTNVNVFSVNNKFNFNWMNGISIVLSIISVLCSVLFPFIHIDDDRTFFLLDEEVSYRYEDIQMFLTCVFLAILLMSLVSIVLELFNKNTLVFNFISAGMMIPLFFITAIVLLTTFEKAENFAPGFGWLSCMALCVSKAVISIISSKKC